MRRHRRGFTLIEIMIVLAVLAVLAAVVIPNVAGFLGRGKERGFESDRRLLQAAADAWRTDVVQRAGNPFPTLTGNKGSITSCAENGVETDGVDAGVIQANCHIIKLTLLYPTYIKGADAVKSFAYSPSTVTGATNVPVGTYIWYIDNNALVQARRWADSSGVGKIDASEISGNDGFVTDVYP